MRLSIDTPELDKLLLLTKEREAIREFMAWVETECKAELGVWAGERLRPMNPRMESLILQFLEIDENKVEQERNALLEAQSRANSEGPKS